MLTGTNTTNEEFLHWLRDAAIARGQPTHFVDCIDNLWSILDDIRDTAEALDNETKERTKAEEERDLLADALAGVGTILLEHMEQVPLKLREKISEHCLKALEATDYTGKFVRDLEDCQA